MIVGMLCSWIEAARLSQNATDHVLKAGATTPIEAPAKVNWLYLPTMLRPSMYLMVGSGKRGSMQVSSIASYLPSAAKASGGNAAIRPAPAATCRKRLRSNRLARRSAQQLQRELAAAGFSAIHPGEVWSLSPGDRRWIERDGGTLIAFEVGSEPPARAGFRVVATHTDSPNLRLRPLPDVTAHGYRQVAVEPFARLARGIHPDVEVIPGVR